MQAQGSRERTAGWVTLLLKGTGGRGGGWSGGYGRRQ